MVSPLWSRCILIHQPSTPAAYRVASVPNDRARKGDRALLCVVYVRTGGLRGSGAVMGRDFGMGVVHAWG